ncbi:hypothetical protein [Rothia dentocariosa]|jgi:hypothetical protein|uniref:AIPR family protein n=1 Tax=Rothia dentocariosa TaxID=2047 RepID=A0A930KKC0_9MICC|nr:hypothetical protein [Rothia dentocariosa]MBF1649849.1 AIPR family protein [Rothia dentocariosa]
MTGIDASYSNVSAIIKIENPSLRVLNNIRRITGFVKVRGLIDIITNLNLDANPRNAKKSPVTKDIIETIRETPELYPFKSKGILIGASECVELERNRYSLSFQNLKLEGILDGGHNTLAIALYLLEESILLSNNPKFIAEKQKELNRVKTWDEMKKFWGKMIRSVSNLKQKESDALDALVPVELLVPDTDSEENIHDFLTSILLICAARNNNVQLRDETLANQDGVFDSLKEILERQIPDVYDKVSWKTNQLGDIDIRFLISLVWIPLGVALKHLDGKGTLTSIKPLPGTTAYSSKSEAVKRYRELIKAKDISEKVTGGDKNTWVVRNSYIKSALEMVPTVLKVYDYVYENFQDAYNKNDGKFGRIEAVKNESKQRRNFITPFGRKNIEGPEKMVPPAGYMMPVVYGLRELVKVDEESETLSWAVDPMKFFGEISNLTKIVGSFMGNMRDVGFDPQRVGKGDSPYSQVANTVKAMRLELEQQQNGRKAEEEIARLKKLLEERGVDTSE